MGEAWTVSVTFFRALEVESLAWEKWGPHSPQLLCSSRKWVCLARRNRYSFDLNRYSKVFNYKMVFSKFFVDLLESTSLWVVIFTRVWLPTFGPPHTSHKRDYIERWCCYYCSRTKRSVATLPLMSCTAFWLGLKKGDQTIGFDMFSVHL